MPKHMLPPEREETVQEGVVLMQNMSWQESEREREDDVNDMELYGPGMNSQDVLEDAPEQVAAGQLTDEERLGYQELQFIENLGSGEFGQVFRGFCRGQEVAIKQLYWDNNIAPEVTIADLTREIESFRHLRHKRLVSFIGACLEVPNLCLVTEYMPGGSLHHLLHVQKLKLPLLHCINMCLQLADGVLYLHSQNPVVVHRDLKSLNVVLDLTLNLKLCDFGLTESMDRTHITKKNNGGSPRYMAPELFDNKSKITEKVDIWSMGCIFTEIFGGPLPYEGINTLADLTREMLVHRRMPQIPSNLPDSIQIVIRSCYNFDARLRPTAKQVFDQLKDAKKRLRAQGLI
jgi:serine/threonine protein kinase